MAIFSLKPGLLKKAACSTVGRSQSSDVMGWLFIGSKICSLPSNGPCPQRLVDPAPSPNSGSQMSDLETAFMAELVISTFEQDIPTCESSLPNRVKKRLKAGVGPPTWMLIVGCAPFEHLSAQLIVPYISYFQKSLRSWTLILPLLTTSRSVI